MHEVFSIVRKDDVYTVTVQPTAKGYQFVRFARPPGGAAGRVELAVVTPSGKLLETLTEKVGYLEFRPPLIDVKYRWGGPQTVTSTL